MIGLMLAEKFPEDYEAYISITQVLNIKESIKISRNWIAEQAKKAGDKETMSVLQKIEKGDTTVCSRPMDCFMKQYELLSKYGGAIYKKESEEEIKKAETSYEDYRDYDWLKAFFFSAYALEDEIFNTDLTTIKELKIPVYFLMGRHDWNLPTSLTVKFNEQLTAPKKEIIWFENSGHEPLEEEAEMFNRVVAGIVK